MMQTLRDLRHRLAHYLGYRRGYVVSAFDDNGTIWIGFRCGICGRVTGIEASALHRPPVNRFS